MLYSILRCSFACISNEVRALIAKCDFLPEADRKL